MPFLLFVIVVAVIIAFFKSSYGRGLVGELTVKMIIGKTKPYQKYVINNLKIRTDSSKTSQIDHIVINQNGIFVIETKNYSGRIYGQQSQHEWTQVLAYGKVKNKFYNPVKQNLTHIYHISDLLPEKYPIFSAVVFVQGNISHIRADGVYRLGGLRRLLKRKTNISLTPEQMRAIYTALTNANDPSISQREHIQNIRSMQREVSRNICPRCGKHLVLRRGSHGDFMGCEGFPSCRFTKSV